MTEEPGGDLRTSATKTIIGIWPLFCFQKPPYPIFKITYTKVFLQNSLSFYFQSRLSPILGTCTPPNPVENVSTAGLGGRPRACKKHKEALGKGSPVTGSNGDGGIPLRGLPVRQVHGSIQSERKFALATLICKSATARNYRLWAVVGLILSSHPNDGCEERVPHEPPDALIADGGRYVGVDGVPLTPTHC